MSETCVQHLSGAHLDAATMDSLPRGCVAARFVAASRGGEGGGAGAGEDEIEGEQCVVAADRVPEMKCRADKIARGAIGLNGRWGRARWNGRTDESRVTGGWRERAEGHVTLESASGPSERTPLRSHTESAPPRPAHGTILKVMKEKLYCAHSNVAMGSGWRAAGCLTTLYYA